MSEQSIMERSLEKNETELDLRGVQPPGDVLKVLSEAGRLSGTRVLRVRLGSNPYQLYDLLQQRGCAMSAVREADGSVAITIRGNANAH